jgi:hypothetical protein
LVERVLCKHEVVGSIPSGSTTVEQRTSRQAIEWNIEFPPGDSLRGFDIVNEGSVRLRRSAKIFIWEFEDGPEKTS